jgi:sporulation protein YlmC with PRC-barrel domain
MPGFDVVWAWVGREVLDQDGVRVGTVREVRYDARTEEPGWALVNLADIGYDLRLVPMVDAEEDGRAVRVPFHQATVRGAPRVGPDACLESHEEAALCRHYGLTPARASLEEPDDDPREVQGVTSLTERREAIVPEPPVHWWQSRSVRCLRGPGRRSTGPLQP